MAKVKRLRLGANNRPLKKENPAARAGFNVIREFRDQYLATIGAGAKGLKCQFRPARIVWKRVGEV